jgi:hypothetical protein
MKLGILLLRTLGNRTFPAMMRFQGPLQIAPICWVPKFVLTKISPYVYLSQVASISGAHWGSPATI